MARFVSPSGKEDGSPPPGVGPPWSQEWRLLRSTSGVDLTPLLREGRWSLLQQHPGRAAYRVEGKGAVYFAKHYAPRGICDRVKDFVLHRKAQRAFRWGQRFGQGGVTTPEPLALYVSGPGLPRQALLVNRWIPKAMKLSAYVQRHAAEGEGATIQQALDGAAKLLAAIHEHGVYHGDLAGNLMVSATNAGTAVHLIDLEELRTPLSWRRRVKNLEELGRGIPLEALSLGRRRAFLQRYASAAGLNRKEARRLWRDGCEAHRWRRERARRRRSRKATRS